MKNITRYPLRSALFLALCAAGSAFAAPPDDGNLDTSWSGDGKTFIGFDLGGAGSNIDVGFSGVVDGQGALYVAGLVLDTQGNGRIGVAKRDPLGGPDGDFDPIVSFLTNVTGKVSAALLPGSPNRIIVAATRQISVSDTDIVVCAFNAEFGFNTAFSAANNPVSGCTTAPLTAGLQRAADIVVQPDGKFVVAGSAAFANAADEKFAYFVRFNPDGSVDGTFETALRRNADLYASHEVRAIELASNGKFVAVGSSESQFTSGTGGLIMRLNADGTLDETSTGGETVFSLDSSPDRDTDFYDLVLEVDSEAGEDAIVVTGSVELNAGQDSGLIARLKGANPVVRDEDFGTTSGFSFLTPPNNNSLVYESIASQPCTGYVVVGDLPVLDTRDALINGWSRDGTINSDFGTSGGTVIDSFAADQIDGGRDIISSGDGVYVAGFTQTNLGDYDFLGAKLFMDSIFCNGFQR